MLFPDESTMFFTTKICKKAVALIDGGHNYKYVARMFCVHLYHANSDKNILDNLVEINVVEEE